ncbi:MAG: hypothetical protein M3Y87_12470 [Myxococcota bacterium]|nr:hypothetical protein [Myxococcota bacterium]
MRPRHRLAPLVLITLLAALARPATARADEPRACPSEAPSDAEVVRRLGWLERRIDAAERDTRLWFTGFVAFQSVLVGVELTLLLSAPTDQDRIDPAVSLLGATVGLTTILALSPPILGAGDLLRSLPRDTPGARLDAMRIAEERLRASAERSSGQRGLVASVASILYTETAALTLLFLGELRGAYMQAGGGILIGLGRIFLHPTTAIDAWRVYSARHPDAACAPGGLALLVEPREDDLRFAIGPTALGPGAGGFALTLAF